MEGSATELGVAPSLGEAVYSFGAYRIEPQLRLLTKRGQRIEIGHRAFDVLLALAEADGAVLGKDELLSRVWGGGAVNENNLQAQIASLRRAFGTDREMISTVFNRGYRLAAVGAPSRTGRVEVAQRAAPSSELPATLTPMIGRDAELVAIADALTSNLVVTLTGIGGIGKTRLAVELGRLLGSHYRDGVCLVELSPLASPALVAPAIAAGIRVDINGPDPAEALGRALGDRHLLLIVDGCEHLLDEVARMVERVLRHASRLRILATSQEPLGIEGERIVRLAGLGVPPPNVRSIGEAMRYSAAHFLIERVAAAEGVTSLDDAQAENICTICRRLDGIPLALDLAAARVAQVGTRAVVEALSDRFALLTLGRRTALPRQQTLRAALEWSFALLSAEEQLFFRRLGLYAGPFTLPAAAAVAGADDAGIWPIADLLAGLTAKSMISKVGDGGEPRFVLSETMRAFVADKLASTGDFALLAAGHAAYFHRRLGQAASDGQRLSFTAWRAEFAADLNDVRAALDWMFSSDAAATAGIQALCASLPFWSQLSLLDECRNRIREVMGRLAPLLEDEPRLRMTLSAALGACTAWARGPLAEGRDAFKRTLHLAVELDDAEHRLQAHYGLWLHDLRSGRYKLSLAAAERLKDEAEGCADEGAALVGRRAAGVSLHFLGDHAAASATIRSTVGPLQRIEPRLRFGLDQGVAALAFLARCEWLRGDVDEAAQLAAQAVETAERLDHATTLCCALLEGSCTIAAFAEDNATLLRQAEAAIAVAERHGLGFWRLYGQAFRVVAELIAAPDAPALDRGCAIVASMRETGFSLGYSVIASHVVAALGRCGRGGEAMAMIEDLLATDAASPAHWGRAEFLRVKSDLLRVTGDTVAAACELSEEAHALSRRQGAWMWERRIMQSRAFRTCPVVD